ncbi:synaptic vesicle glycoprotein 2B-like isoform X3 [Aphidius gifuensis]|nr:synaptic vesicle glycoprotein 2B-like isoform X3 [Aphidius gifuensis]
MVAIFAGLSLSSDTIEFFVVPYILPSAEVELCIEDNEKSWLKNISLFGLALGGFAWGGLGDRIGRRRALLSAMSVHLLFITIATFMPTYGTLMSVRFWSAIGMGGAMPLAYAYLAECCPRGSRSIWIGILVAAGALGGVYVALLAWFVVPTTGEMIVLENKAHFSAWHRFLIFCCLPALFSIVGLIFLPESPRYLIEAGHDVEAMMVYQKIYKKNNTNKNTTGSQYQLSELELPSKRSRGQTNLSSSISDQTVLGDIIHSINLFKNSFCELFTAQYIRVTITLFIIWSTIAFVYYGILIWCPEYLKYIRANEYTLQSKSYYDKEFNGTIFTGSLDNLQYKKSKFFNCQFNKMIISHVKFYNCTFKSVDFTSIRSSKTYFIDSEIVDSKFVDTDLSSQAFIRCKFENNTDLSLKGPCPTLDLDYNIYIEETLHAHLVAQLAFIFAAAFAGFALNEFRRPKMIGLSLFISSIGALCIIFVQNHTSLILSFEGGFMIIFSIAWTLMTLVTLESYPAHIRCCGFGIMAVGIRLSGLIGTVIYQNLIDAPLIAPALLTAITLFIASVAAFKLPDTHVVFL